MELEGVPVVDRDALRDAVTLDDEVSATEIVRDGVAIGTLLTVIRRAVCLARKYRSVRHANRYHVHVADMLELGV
jgi:hypothetical protein